MEVLNLEDLESETEVVMEDIAADAEEM